MRDLTYPPIIAAAKLGFRLLGQRIELQGTDHPAPAVTGGYDAPGTDVS